jgi:hypothetical protein
VSGSRGGAPAAGGLLRVLRAGGPKPPEAFPRGELASYPEQLAGRRREWNELLGNLGDKVQWVATDLGTGQEISAVVDSAPLNTVSGGLPPLTVVCSA